MAGEIMTPLQMLERLVAFDTVSAHSNMALIEYVHAYLAGHGIEGRIGRSPTGEKANLVASVGPAVPGGIILSGHTDVVPVKGQPWTNDPFKLVARNGHVVGRGSADMKGFIAVALALVPEFIARGLKRPIHFALSYDEEVGCLGAPLLLSDLVAGMPRPGLAIIGEPTMMQLINRHKGFAGHETTVTGRDGHSSRTHRGVNAVMAAGEVIGFLSGLAAEFRDKGPFDDGFDPPY